jgi:phosphoribosylformimino-5-aminoimidazole carboxamide ribotide isomerase
MIIYPAIDMRAGKVVRLKEGDPNRQTVFSDDPIATAHKWVEQGAAWLHMVNLDGAFADANDNGSILERAAQMNIPIQFGGGLRQMDDIARAFDQGASRVVLGTIAIQHPEVVMQAIERWGAEAICVGLDSRDGKVATHGWMQKADLTPIELGKRMAQEGVKHALYTDVSRDGHLQGVNVEGTAALVRETGLQVIASGGVSSLDDVRRLSETRIIAGVVIGMALYEGRLSLRDAILIGEGKDAG